MSTYRDDAEATAMRVEALERENKQLATELAVAKALIGSGSIWVTKRGHVLVVAIAVVMALVGTGVGMLLGKSDCPDTVAAATAPTPLPAVTGTLAVRGPGLARWSMKATRCVPHEGEIEITTVGFEGHSLWLSTKGVEIEANAKTVKLDATTCTRFEHVLTPKGASYDGTVDIDCAWGDGNTASGRLEVHDCR